jgi:hypothetical protein
MSWLVQYVAGVALWLCSVTLAQNKTKLVRKTINRRHNYDEWGSFYCVCECVCVSERVCESVCEFVSVCVLVQVGNGVRESCLHHHHHSCHLLLWLMM